MTKARGRAMLAIRVAAIVVAGLAAAQMAAFAYGVFSYMLPLGSLEDEPDPTTQPLEIVADAQEPACVVNVPSVAPGRHEVYVLAVGAAAQVTVEDPAGQVLLRASAEPRRSDEVRSVVLEEVGTHRVECRHDGGATTAAQLRVAPADEVTRQ